MLEFSCGKLNKFPMARFLIVEINGDQNMEIIGGSCNIHVKEMAAMLRDSWTWPRPQSKLHGLKACGASLFIETSFGKKKRMRLEEVPRFCR
jgi:hypothetical protein